MTEYPYPVFGTQGGGLAREVGGRYVFVEAPPEGMGLKVGDEVPREWDLAPANNPVRTNDLFGFYGFQGPDEFIKYAAPRYTGWELVYRAMAGLALQ